MSAKPSSYGPRPWQQTSWDWRAAANFILGGSGAGLAVASALALHAPRPGMLLALLLIATGLGAVWLEIGRKLRAAHVFFNPFTSWMTRESYAALLLFALGLAYLVLNEPWLKYALALAALGFVFCQGRILRAAKGIPAWRAPQVVALVLCTSMAEGTALLMLVQPDTLVSALFAAAVIARAVAWSRYWLALPPSRSREALAPVDRGMLQAGTLAPLVLALATLALPQAAILAGLAALLAGWWFKFVLVTRAALNQGFSLPQLPVRGAR
jgi:phenylacetyl-CoA:acceptor oxidoreductase subunit 2